MWPRVAPLWCFLKLVSSIKSVDKVQSLLFSSSRDEVHSIAISVSVCLSVSLLACQKPRLKFTIQYVLSALVAGPALTTLEYVMYFRFPVCV